MTMLADTADFVIGVDTHRDTHTASIVTAPGGAATAEITCATTPAGLAELVAFADRHPGRRAWAVEGTASYGVGLLRLLHELGEQVIETERPHRTNRRRGKSDSIDATRDALEALAAEHPAEHRTRGDRAALASLLAGRHSAVDAASVGRRQLHAFTDDIRSRFQGAGRRKIITIAAGLRTHSLRRRDHPRSARSLDASEPLTQKLPPTRPLCAPSSSAGDPTSSTSSAAWVIRSSAIQGHEVTPPRASVSFGQEPLARPK